MENILPMDDINHPCHGKDCRECESCIFDDDLFLNKMDKGKCTSCHLCDSLVKDYIGDDRLRFNACCKRSTIMYNNYSRPRVIMVNCGQMLPLTPPEWCPRNRGVTKECMSSNILLGEEYKKNLPVPMGIKEEKKEPEKKYLTYAERREEMMKFPKHLTWDEIEEDGIYVIPKILNQSRKVIRVIVKSENFIRCSEIDEFGKESSALSSIYPKDIDMVFITKVLKF